MKYSIDMGVQGVELYLFHLKCLTVKELNI